MKPILLFWLINLLALPGFAQDIASKVYAWNQAPVVKQAGLEDRTILQGSTRDFASLSLHAITLFAHQPSPPMQELDEEALVIVKEGILTITLDGKSKTLGPGSVALIMPGDPYRLENRETTPLTYYLMRYTSNQMPDLDLYRLMGESFWIDWKDVAYTTHEKGGVRRLFDCGTVMTKRFELHATTLKPGLWSHAPHTHRPAEIMILMDNAVQESIGDQRQPVAVGDVVFLESGVLHSGQNTSQQPCTYLAFQFN